MAKAIVANRSSFHLCDLFVQICVVIWTFRILVADHVLGISLCYMCRQSCFLVEGTKERALILSRREPRL